MMQLWLVVIAAVLLWRADQLDPWPWQERWLVEPALRVAGWALIVASVVLTFVAGGTVG